MSEQPTHDKAQLYRHTLAMAIETFLEQTDDEVMIELAEDGTPITITPQGESVTVTIASRGGDTYAADILVTQEADER